MQGLTDVDLSHCETMTDTGVLSIIRNCVHLRRLSLANCSSIGE